MKNWIQIASVVLIASIPLCLVAANGQQVATLAGAKPKATVTQAAEPKTYSYHMGIVAITYSYPTEWVFVIERSGFKSSTDLKKGISSLPAGSVLELKTGGRKFPNEPLSSEKDLADFRKFCESKNVKLVFIPGK